MLKCCSFRELLKSEKIKRFQTTIFDTCSFLFDTTPNKEYNLTFFQTYLEVPMKLGAILFYEAVTSLTASYIAAVLISSQA